MQEILLKTIFILGCGNTLFGDDGFGPELTEHLKLNYSIPENVSVIDAGTGVRDLLFDILLTPNKPTTLFIVDAVCFEKIEPGVLLELELESIPIEKICDYSLHQFPSVNLLKEIKYNTGVDVRILAVQAKSIPDFVKPGLSYGVAQAIEPACKWLINQIKRS